MDIRFATTWNSNCGVADYSRSLTAELEQYAQVRVVSIDPGSFTSPGQITAELNRGDVAHVQFQYPFFGGMAFHRNWFRRVLSDLRVPLVVTVHELDLGDRDGGALRAYKRWFNRWLFTAPRVSRVIVHSSEYRGRLEGLGIKSSLIRVVPMWVPEVRRPEISPDAAKQELGLAGKKTVTIFGFVVRRKGYETALESLPLWSEDAVLLIAGGPHEDDHTGYFSELADRVSDAGLTDRVRITGYLPDDRVPVVMAATDIIAAPFTAMSSSWSMMHAIAYGKPIIASDLPPNREMSEQYGCLTLFRSGDSDDLAARVNELLGDASSMEKATAAVRSCAESRTVARAAAETVAVYRELARCGPSLKGLKWV